MRVLVAPDKFRGTLTARQAAEAVATGWRRTRPDDRLDLAPMADGGEGTMTALVDALRGEVVRVPVTGPRGDQVEAEYGIAQGADGRVAVVEMASASGLALLVAVSPGSAADHDARDGRADPRRRSDTRPPR